MTDDIKANSGEKTLDDQWGEALSEQETAGPKPAPAQAQSKVQAQAKPAPFGELRQESGAPVGNIDMILDIPLTISVELGRSKILVKDLLQLGQGAVVELEKVAGEPLEIMVNGKLLARGEAVVVNDKFGVKLTDIVSPSERINRLK